MAAPPASRAIPQRGRASRWPASSGVCGLMRLTARAGAMVMALMAEMIVEAAIVRANWR